MTAHTGNVKVVLLWQHELRIAARSLRAVGDEPPKDASQDEHRAWMQRVYDAYQAASAALYVPENMDDAPMIVCSAPGPAASSC